MVTLLAVVDVAFPAKPYLPLDDHVEHERLPGPFLLVDPGAESLGRIVRPDRHREFEEDRPPVVLLGHEVHRHRTLGDLAAVIGS